MLEDYSETLLITFNNKWQFPLLYFTSLKKSYCHSNESRWAAAFKKQNVCKVSIFIAAMALEQKILWFENLPLCYHGNLSNSASIVNNFMDHFYGPQRLLY